MRILIDTGLQIRALSIVLDLGWEVLPLFQLSMDDVISYQMYQNPHV